MTGDNNNSRQYSGGRSNESLRAQLNQACRTVFGFDLRSLAAFRIAIGLLLISDLVYRAGTLVEMYTRDGFYTRELSQDYYRQVYGQGWESVFWSVHWISDSPHFQFAMFGVAAFFAALLIIGKWTRVATLASWVLLVSIHVRNPVVLSSGDFLLKMMLFWSFFLPLGSVWSLDARRRKSNGMPRPDVQKRLVSVATAGFLIQLFAMYFFTGLAKWNEGWWSGDAMFHALGLEMYTTDFGRQLLEYPLLLKFASIGTVFAEVFLIWTLFSSRNNDCFRLINILVFWSFHIGIALSMAIGLFPWICMIGWLPLLPSGIWNLLGEPNSSQAKTALEPGNYFRFGPAQKLFCALMIGFILVWNLGNIEGKLLDPLKSKTLTNIGYFMRVDQHFQMFGEPPKTTPWFVYEAVLQDGSEVDLLTGNQVDPDKPSSMIGLLPSFHWRKLHRNLVSPQRECLRQPLAEYMVAQWNRTHENKVNRMRMMYYEEDTGPNRESQNRHSKVWAVVKSAEGSPGSLFDRLSDENKKDDALELGF